MKKFALVLSLIMLLPLNALALQTLSEDDMGGITGQAGVSIAIDDVKLYQNIGYLSYTDDDGVDGTAGTVSVSNLYMMVHVNALTEATGVDGTPFVSPGRDIQGTYAVTDPTGVAFNYKNTATPAGADTIFIAKALTIDVGTMPVLTAGLTNNAQYMTTAPDSTNVAGVRIGLPTVEIFQSALSFDVTVDSVDAVTGVAAYNSGASYGRISIGNMTMAVLDGAIEIAPH
ncbi:MAG: hypothetical protein VR64_02925 [Desulfatitalea sp. BRH_c12]|nr:MAG: hypothetical protein VR64_02925 [Desulfatitalea sp. BRH_c12]